jgi:hypothetical protein
MLLVIPSDYSVAQKKSMNDREPDLTGFKNLSGLVPATTWQSLNSVIPSSLALLITNSVNLKKESD